MLPVFEQLPYEFQGTNVAAITRKIAHQRDYTRASQ